MLCCVHSTVRLVAAHLFVLFCCFSPSHLAPVGRAGASAYVEMALIPSELDPKYARACLHLTAILGKDHLLPPPAPSLVPTVPPLLSGRSSADALAAQPVDAASAAAAAAAPPISVPTSATAAVAAAASATPASRLAGVRVKRVDLLPRPRRDILIIDSDAATAAAYPHNTLLLPSHEAAGGWWDGILPAASAAGASSTTASGAAAGPGGSNGPSHPPARVPSAGAQELSVNVRDDLQLAASLVSLYKTAAAQRILQERRQQQASMQQAAVQQLPVQQGQGHGVSSGRADSAVAPSQASSAASARVVQRAADIAAWLAYFKERAVREAAAGAATPPPIGAAASANRHIDSAGAPAGTADTARGVAAASPVALLAASRVVLRSVAEIELRHRAAAAARLAQPPAASVQQAANGSAKGATAAPPLK
jgi:hypothetical protein